MLMENDPTPRSPGDANAIDSPSLESVDELRWVMRLTDLLDSRFRIPGTQTEFGFDFLLGLIPGLGDMVSLTMSGAMLATMAKHGASGQLVARMLLNVVLDAIVGTFPILGNIFDLYFKANRRNLNLMREHYVEGKHTGSIWPWLIVVFGIALAMIIVVVWFSIWLLHSIWQSIAGT